jgi:hypothetical protein
LKKKNRMTTTPETSKVLNSCLWIAQTLLSLTLIWAAAMKLFKSPEALAAMWPWTGDHPQLTKITGIFDLLAGIGLVLPGLLRIQPKLVVYAAFGTIALMIAAVIFHFSRGEGAQTGFNFFVIAMAAFIAWGRGRKK